MVGFHRGVLTSSQDRKSTRAVRAYTAWSKTFHETGDFAATRAAEDWCQSRGFSVGEMCRGSPRGLRLGDWSIQKWHNLDVGDRLALDGIIEGDARNGPVTVRLNKEPSA